MHAIDLIIGDYVHRLPMDVDEAAVLAQLMAGILAGGGVVDLPTASTSASVSVLISPGVPVFVERTEIPNAPGEEQALPGDHSEWPFR